MYVLMVILMSYVNLYINEIHIFDKSLNLSYTIEPFKSNLEQNVGTHNIQHPKVKI